MDESKVSTLKNNADFFANLFPETNVRTTPANKTNKTATIFIFYFNFKFKIPLQSTGIKG